MAEGRIDILKDIKLFVLDMDGTFYLGNIIIPGSLKFLDRVNETGRRFMFFTNNASQTPDFYINKLHGMGCDITPEQIMTSGDVTIQYLNTFYRNKKVYLMGTQALKDSFAAGGVNLVENETPDVAVASFDKELTYEKLDKICEYVRGGAVFLATHPDINCPTEDGFIPDCGALCAAISLSSGGEPRYLGKPYPETAEMILDRTGLRREEIAFVGDRLYTDIAVGVKNGFPGLLVLSGETKRADVETSSVKPDAIFRNLEEIAEYL